MIYSGRGHYAIILSFRGILILGGCHVFDLMVRSLLSFGFSLGKSRRLRLPWYRKDNIEEIKDSGVVGHRICCVFICSIGNSLQHGPEPLIVLSFRISPVM